MTNEVTVKQPALPGFVPDVEAATIAAAYHAKIDDYGQGVLGLPSLPTAQERAILEQRDAELRRLLQPISYATADRDRAMKAFGRLFLGYPTLQNVNLMEKSAGYVIDLGELPAFAIEAAVDDVKKCRVRDLDPDYPPSSPRMYKIAEEHRDRVAAKEHRPIQRVLSVRMLSKPKQTEEQTEKVGELMRGLATSLSSEAEDRDRDFRKPLLDAQARRNNREVEAEWDRRGLARPEPKPGKKAFPISVALAEKLGIVDTSKTHPNAPGRK